jgi:hypothetical protein
MPILTTVAFRFITPADAVTAWRALTDDPRHYEGLTVESDWHEGSIVRLRVDGPSVERLSIEGEVLYCSPGARLSHTLGGHPGRPEVYVTWNLQPEAGGTIVELCVDELSSGRYGIDGRPEEVADIEAAWQPVVDALRAEITRCLS